MLATPRARPPGLVGWLPPARRLGIVVVQHPHARRIEVVELSAPGRPHERAYGRGDDQQRERQHDIDDAHESSLNVRDRQDATTTVSELAGMRIAAASGVRRPVIARLAPTTLYASENATLRLITRKVRRAPSVSRTTASSP